MTGPVTPPAPIKVEARFRFRRAWANEWVTANPVLRDGEPGYDKTNNMLKMGDGVTPWNQLRYLTPPEEEGAVNTGDVAIDTVMNAHIQDSTPHPAYDDGPSLLLLWQNAKL